MYGKHCITHKLTKRHTQTHTHHDITHTDTQIAKETHTHTHTHILVLHVQTYISTDAFWDRRKKQFGSFAFLIFFKNVPPEIFVYL